MAVEPPHDPVVVKGLLVAMLCKLCEECEGADFDPMESLAGLIRFRAG